MTKSRRNNNKPRRKLGLYLPPSKKWDHNFQIHMSTNRNRSPPRGRPKIRIHRLLKSGDLGRKTNFSFSGEQEKDRLNFPWRKKGNLVLSCRRSEGCMYGTGQWRWRWSRSERKRVLPWRDGLGHGRRDFDDELRAQLRLRSETEECM